MSIRDAAHVAIWAQTWPYRNSEIGKKYPILEHRMVPQILFTSRWDGMLGLPGGFLDAGETPEQAVIRECHEELGHLLEMPPLQPVTCHEHQTENYGVVRLHFFEQQVSAEALQAIVAQAVSHPEFGVEITGVLLGQVINFGSKHEPKGWSRFVQNRIIPGCRPQICTLLTKYGWEALLAPVALTPSIEST